MGGSPSRIFWVDPTETTSGMLLGARPGLCGGSLQTCLVFPRRRWQSPRGFRAGAARGVAGLSAGAPTLRAGRPRDPARRPSSAGRGRHRALLAGLGRRAALVEASLLRPHAPRPSPPPAGSPRLLWDRSLTPRPEPPLPAPQRLLGVASLGKPRARRPASAVLGRGPRSSAQPFWSQASGFGPVRAQGPRRGSEWALEADPVQRVRLREPRHLDRLERRRGRERPAQGRPRPLVATPACIVGGRSPGLEVPPRPPRGPVGGRGESLGPAQDASRAGASRLGSRAARAERQVSAAAGSSASVVFGRRRRRAPRAPRSRLASEPVGSRAARSRQGRAAEGAAAGPGIRRRPLLSPPRPTLASPPPP